MNKRTKYVIKQVSVGSQGGVNKRVLVSRKFILSFSRIDLAEEVCCICNKVSTLRVGELACYYEVTTIPNCVPSKTVNSLSEFVESLQL